MLIEPAWRARLEPLLLDAIHQGDIPALGAAMLEYDIGIDFPRDPSRALTYVLATNLLESVVVLCGPLALAVVLPSRWFRDVFVARGSSLCIAGLGYLMFLADRFKDKIAYPALPLAAWTVPVALALIALAVYLGGRIPVVRRLLEAAADRVTIFVFILVPASILSVIAICIRLVVR